MDHLKGVFSAVATPFTKDNDLDLPRLKSLVDETIAGGVHGLVPNGSTGEFQTQTMDERKEVVATVLAQANNRVPVMPHVGALRTDDAVELAKHAESSGAAAVMAVAPFYEPLELDEIKAYYKAIAAAVSIPVMIYNLPVATGVPLSPEDVVEIAEQSENIRYVKDTTGDFSQAAKLIHDFQDKVTAFIGTDPFFLANFFEGGSGTIVGATNFLAPQLVSIYEAVQNGEYGRAKKEWAVVFPLMQFLASGGYVAGVKGALELLGKSAGSPRAPIAPLSTERSNELSRLLKDAGLLQ